MGIEVIRDTNWSQADYAKRKTPDETKDILKMEVYADDQWNIVFNKTPAMLALFGSTPPAGWQVCDGSGFTVNLNGLYAKAGEKQGVATGSNMHTHDELSINTGGPSGKYGSGIISNTSNTGTHVHSFLHTHEEVNHEPAYYTMIPAIQTTAVNYPANMLFFWDGDNVLSGWSYWSAVENKFIKFDTETAGLTGGGTHTHSFTGFSGYTQTASRKGGIGSNETSDCNHRHAVNHTHSAFTNLPNYIGFVPIRNDSSLEILPSGLISFFLGDLVPYGWKIYSIALGKFVRCMATKDLQGSGSNVHGHSQDSFSTAAKLESGTKNTNTGTNCARRTHTHGITHGHLDPQTMEPRHIRLMLCKKD